jgi:SAM-dependent methyltransferase
MKSKDLARRENRGTLKLAVCEGCGFIFNLSFEPRRLRYGESYDNSQEFSPFFEGYLSRLVRYLVFERGVRNSRIVEIGCGKGRFLRKLVESDSGNIGLGFDPSYVGPATDLGGRLRFENDYYGPEYTGAPADVVFCRHVIEHVPDPLNLLGMIRQALRGSPNARIFFETPSAEWILRNRVIWDLFYEHCSYFTAESLTTAFEISGFRVESVRRVFSEQYLWLEASLSTEGTTVNRGAGDIPDLARRLAESEGALIDSIRARIRDLAGRGKVAIWGAGAKGVTILNLVDPDCRCIECVVDLNPNKWGHYIPGTGHPIVGYKELGKYGVNVAVLMNPNYRDENLSLLRGAQLDIDLIDLTECLEGV